MTPQDQLDDDLVRRFKQGDQAAFDELALRHRDAVYRFVRARLETARGEAEDATQDVLLEVYRCLGRYEGRSRLRTWILGVAANVCRQRWRSRLSAARLPGVCETIETLRELPDGSPGLEAALDLRSLQNEVRAAIESLGPEHRVVLLLREMEELSYGDIAALLQVPLGTVRSRLHNARALLAARLRPRAGTESD